jgi:hypothetical protein
VPLSRALFSFSQIPANSGFRRSNVSDRGFPGLLLPRNDGSDPDPDRLANWVRVFQRGPRRTGRSNKAGMSFAIRDWDGETLEAHKDCDRRLSG